jgi:hypothetical protein
MAKFQRVNDWIIKDNCFSIKYNKYELRIENLNENVVCSIFRDSKKLDFNFPDFERAFEFANEFMNQKDFDKKADTFRISNNLKEKLSKIYNS